MFVPTPYSVERAGISGWYVTVRMTHRELGINCDGIGLFTIYVAPWR